MRRHTERSPTGASRVRTPTIFWSPEPHVCLQTACSCPRSALHRSVTCSQICSTSPPSSSSNGRGEPSHLLFWWRRPLTERAAPRFGPKYKINPAEDFTRLTLDTIALCSMSYRCVNIPDASCCPLCSWVYRSLNSFYRVRTLRRLSTRFDADFASCRNQVTHSCSLWWTSSSNAIYARIDRASSIP